MLIILKKKKLFFIDIEFGTCSLYEFIYSCRDSYESPFPDLLSNTTINALHQLKKIKNEISSGIKKKKKLTLFIYINQLFYNFYKYIHNIIFFSL